MTRTRLARRTPLTRGGRITPKAKPKAERQRIAAVRAEVFARQAYRCAVCSDPCTQLHEVVFRSQGGRMDTANSVGLCLRHHRAVHDRRLWLSWQGHTLRAAWRETKETSA